MQVLWTIWSLMSGPDPSLLATHFGSLPWLPFIGCPLPFLGGRLVSRAQPWASLRAEHKQLCKPVKYKWACEAAHGGAVGCLEKVKQSEFVTKSNKLWPLLTINSGTNPLKTSCGPKNQRTFTQIIHMFLY